jgi:hypothetical protein
VYLVSRYGGKVLRVILLGTGAAFDLQQNVYNSDGDGTNPSRRVSAMTFSAYGENADGLLVLFEE